MDFVNCQAFVLGPLGTILVILGSMWGPYGATCARLGLQGRFCQLTNFRFEPAWGIVGFTFDLYGTSWAHFGKNADFAILSSFILSPLGPIWV